MQFIIEKIKNSPAQRITFAEFMALALYHPQAGYYASGKAKIGKQGDFFTSSSLGSDFGELLAEQFLEMWENLGCPKEFKLVEVGAGRGFLATDILAYLQLNYSDFYRNLSYIIIEASPGQIQQQQALIQETNKITWKTWNEIAEKSLTGCIFSNELIDAFPVHQVTIQNEQLQEIYLTVDEGKLKESMGELSTPKLLDYFQALEIKLPSSDYPDGYRTEVNLAALDWLETVSKKLDRGYLLTIDYGYSAEKYYHPQRDQGTLQCYYQHRRHNNPYVNIGQQDITTHVNFTALEKHRELLGLETLGLTQQALFLMNLGVGDRLTNLSSEKYNLPEIFQRRDVLHQLIDPMGLGGFKVLVQCKGLIGKEKARSLKGLKNL